MQVRGPGVGRDPEGSTMPTLQPAGRWDSTDGVPLCKDAECAEHLEPTQRKPQPELPVHVPMTGQIDFTEGTVPQLGEVETIKPKTWRRKGRVWPPEAGEAWGLHSLQKRPGPCGSHVIKDLWAKPQAE